MSYSALLFLSLGVAADATAVSAARGLAVPRVLPRHVLLVALFFGGAQALMPLLGYLFGAQLGPLIARFDHWVAFVLLAGIGGKMLWEARGDDDDEARPGGDPFDLRLMSLLALATSVDAFAVGVSLPVLGARLLPAVATIGLTTALASAGGLFAGRRFGAALGPRLEALGGVVLIGLGVKILLEHLAAG